MITAVKGRKSVKTRKVKAENKYRKVKTENKYKVRKYSYAIHTCIYKLLFLVSYLSVCVHWRLFYATWGASLELSIVSNLCGTVDSRVASGIVRLSRCVIEIDNVQMCLPIVRTYRPVADVISRNLEIESETWKPSKIGSVTPTWPFVTAATFSNKRVRSTW